MKVFLLHGFLGLPSDWKMDGFEEFEKVDVFKLAPGTSLKDWANRLNDSVRGLSEKPLLVGYSMGARLAMHASTQAPELWRGVVLISGNPGLEEPRQRSARIHSDETWARRFETESWETLVSAWEAQPAFGGNPIPFPRREADFRRSDLAHALRAWSLGSQENLTPALAELPLPLFWVAGESDRRYVDYGKALLALRKHPTRLWIAPGACHRVPWETPKAFKENFCRFLSEELKGPHYDQRNLDHPQKI
jgi:2-succinyl-6-hydroxy-2,4-cyclohexadiene-1-carboxylate synthase